ncbi:MAG: hypothetical protein WC942_11475 [Clostridia bacterium]|jgi:hypothetical protein
MKRKYLYFCEYFSIISAGIYLLNNFYLKGKYPSNMFLHCYLNDILTFPVAFPILLFLFSILKLRKFWDFPTLSEYTVYFILWSFIFEYFGPFILKTGTSDILDVLCYFIGILLMQVSFSLNYKKNYVFPIERTFQDPFFRF